MSSVLFPASRPPQPTRGFDRNPSANTVAGVVQQGLLLENSRQPGAQNRQDGTALLGSGRVATVDTQSQGLDPQQGASVAVRPAVALTTGGTGQSPCPARGPHVVEIRRRVACPDQARRGRLRLPREAGPARALSKRSQCVCPGSVWTSLPNLFVTRRSCPPSGVGDTVNRNAPPSVQLPPRAFQ